MKKKDIKIQRDLLRTELKDRRLSISDLEKSISKLSYENERLRLTLSSKDVELYKDKGTISQYEKTISDQSIRNEKLRYELVKEKDLHADMQLAYEIASQERDKLKALVGVHENIISNQQKELHAYKVKVLSRALLDVPTNWLQVLGRGRRPNINLEVAGDHVYENIANDI